MACPFKFESSAGDKVGARSSLRSIHQRKCESAWSTRDTSDRCPLNNLHPRLMRQAQKASERGSNFSEWALKCFGAAYIFYIGGSWKRVKTSSYRKSLAASHYGFIVVWSKTEWSGTLCYDEPKVVLRRPPSIFPAALLMAASVGSRRLNAGRLPRRCRRSSELLR